MKKVLLLSLFFLTLPCYAGVQKTEPDSSTKWYSLQSKEKIGVKEAELRIEGMLHYVTSENFFQVIDQLNDNSIKDKKQKLTDYLQKKKDAKPMDEIKVRRDIESHFNFTYNGLKATLQIPFARRFGFFVFVAILAMSIFGVFTILNLLFKRVI
ncbi:hypothetical protein K4L44_06495 [Halosquirtibacter laminarini]|uniref:Uncharacterized protein n=1 Tax=Halosquirtibacter laminarini TaxID=3374600 RepID=A0AC61NID4_9BACT|nr:hypothetical protein K4L44_06495 [Prolixibacteraceae bacterium]